MKKITNSIGYKNNKRLRKKKKRDLKNKMKKRIKKMKNIVL